MKKFTACFGAALLLAVIFLSFSPVNESILNEDQRTQTPNQLDPGDSLFLLQDWTGPYGGVPPFDKMRLEHLKPALIKGMEISQKEYEAIADAAGAPNFENTIAAWERAGKDLDRALTCYWIYSSNLSTPEFRAIQTEMAPLLSEHYTRINQNEKLFHKVRTVYEASLKNPLDPDQQRLVELVYKRFARNGADLDPDKKARYTEINKELSELYTRFSNNVLHDEEAYITYLSADQVGGLSEGFLKAAARVAADNGRDGAFAITNTRSSMDPFLTYSTERGLRKEVWSKYYSRGDNGDAYDNKQIIADILRLRRERVALQGYDNYGQWRLQDRMAKSPENAMALMEAVWPAAIARVAEEVADMQAVADRNDQRIRIEPWDYRYYAEKVRQEKYQLDSDEVKEYLQLDNLIEALFYVAGRVFDLNFVPVPDGTVPVFHPQVRVWEVTGKSTGEHVGLLYIDPYARTGKRSGAWATSYRQHSTFDGDENVLASMNTNFIEPAPGEAPLVSWDDATTLFHEFGHALHALSSTVRYPTLNGGVRDFTEFQSQVLEHWLPTDEVINRYLVHHETGEPIPAELVARIKNAEKFNQGFMTTEYLASALMDMKLHLADPAKIDVASFEKETLAALNMPGELPMRHRTPHFSHVFSGEGYATAYYSYMWADVLVADAAEAFAEASGGFYDKDTAEKLVQYLFAPRNSVDPAEAYLQFRGREAKIDAFMRDRGFPVGTEMKH